MKSEYNQKGNIMRRNLDLGEFLLLLVVCSCIWMYFGYIGDFVAGGIISVLAMFVICLYNNSYEMGKKLKDLENKIENQVKDSDIKTV